MTSPASPPSSELPEKREGQQLIRVGIVVFIAAFAAMFGIAALRGGVSSEETSVPGFALTRAAVPQRDGSFRVTLDSSDSDLWVPLNLSSGAVSKAGEPADIEARRFMLRAPRGALDLGAVGFDDVAIPSDANWVVDEGEGEDASNPLLSRWYDYGFWSHKLSPKDATYGVRLASGQGVAVLRVESYECASEGAGCLTLSYRIIPSETP